MGGRAREGGSRAKPGNQLVYIYIYIYIYTYIYLYLYNTNSVCVHACVRVCARVRVCQV